MEKMQEYIDYIFRNVWSIAKGKGYEVDVLFSGNIELKEIITELHTSEVDGANFFLTGLELVFEDFKKLSSVELALINHWYESNNNIELACAGDPNVTPATYSTVTQLSAELSKNLKDFFKNLYSQSFLSLKSIKDRIGIIEGHYHDFMEVNNEGKCPFCGINDVKGLDHSKREAYDHYLPKDKYPFNSINFYNLVPTCHECNSSYKLTKNPLFTNTGQRRKAFYPFSNNSPSIEIEVILNITDWSTMSKNDIHLNTGPDHKREEIATWVDVYGIEERYKAKCCGENDGKGWIREIVDESANYGLTPQQYLNGKLKTSENDPWVDDNFLRKPFLDACKKAGLFNL